MATPSEILGDPNFHGLPVEEKRKVMLAVDPQGFGALPPEEQDKVFSTAAQQGAPKPEANPFADYKPMTWGEKATMAAKQLGQAVISPVTGLLSIPGQLGKYAQELYQGHQIQPHTVEGNPLEQAQGNAMASAMTSSPQAVADAARTTARTARGATAGAYNAKGVKTGGVSGAAIGGMIGGKEGAEIGAAIGGGVPLLRGAIQGGLEAYRNAPPTVEPVAPEPFKRGQARNMPKYGGPTEPTYGSSRPNGRRGVNRAMQPEVGDVGEETPELSKVTPPEANIPTNPNGTVPTVPAENAYPLSENAVPNLKGTKESAIKGARTVRGKAIGRYLRDEGVPVEQFSKWDTKDPRWKRAADAAGVTPPNSPESVQAIIEQFKAMKPKGNGGEEPWFAKGGVVTAFAKGGIVVPDAPPKMDRKSSTDAPPSFKELASGEDIIRGTSNIPLSPKGLEQAKLLGERFKAKGGIDHIISSDLHRAVQTANGIAKATGAKIVDRTKQLQPWALGEIEGQPTKKVLDQINRYILKKPNVAVPGKGPLSTSKGESFANFKRRTLNFVKEGLSELKANPQEKVVWVTHYRDLRLLESWIKKGAPSSLEIDAPHMAQKGDPPGSVHRLYCKDGKVTLDKVNMDSGEKLSPGIYVVRHGCTRFNGENG